MINLDSITNIEDYVEFIIKKYEALIETLPIEFYSNKITNLIVFKIKTGYKFEFSNF